MVDADPDPLIGVLMVPGADPLAVLEHLALLRPAWHANAACSGMGTELFFPERGEDARPARAICSGCPVVAPCAAAADDYGVWGGMSGRQRRRAEPTAAPSESVLLAAGAYQRAVRAGEMFPTATAAAELGISKATLKARLVKARAAGLLDDDLAA